MNKKLKTALLTVSAATALALSGCGGNEETELQVPESTGEVIVLMDKFSIPTETNGQETRLSAIKSFSTMDGNFLMGTGHISANSEQIVGQEVFAADVLGVTANGVNSQITDELLGTLIADTRGGNVTRAENPVDSAGMIARNEGSRIMRVEEPQPGEIARLFMNVRGGTVFFYVQVEGQPFHTTTSGDDVKWSQVRIIDDVWSANVPLTVFPSQSGSVIVGDRDGEDVLIGTAAAQVGGGIFFMAHAPCMYRKLHQAAEEYVLNR